MKNLPALCILISAVLCLHPLDAQTFSWDLMFLKGRESIPISRMISKKTGDEFSIFITPSTDCFLYVIARDSEDNYSVLFHDPLRGGQTKKIGEEDRAWMIGDPPGTETLYVIMSQKRQQRMEDRIKSFNENPGSIRSIDNLREELARLQEEASGLGQPGVAFVPGGGSSRGNQEYVSRFSEKDMYVRPIRIQH